MPEMSASAMPPDPATAPAASDKQADGGGGARLRILHAQQNAGQHHGRGAHAQPLALQHAAGDMALGDVCDFMGEHARQLAFATGGGNQSAVDADVAAGHGEGVDAGTVDHEEGELVLAGVGVARQPHAKILDVPVDRRILHQRQILPQLAHEACAEAPLVGGRHGLIRRLAHLRQRQVEFRLGGPAREGAVKAPALLRC